MSDKRFLQAGLKEQTAHVIEEMGEAQAAAGKTLRWGFLSVNPLLPPDQQEYNAAWLWREMTDVEEAIGRLKETMSREFPNMEFATTLHPNTGAGS